jgi:CheY-like chemotaxis protein
MKVLCIEDNDGNISLIRRIANVSDIEVVSYKHGEEAVANFHIDQPHLVLVDYSLAGQLNGLQTFKALRQIDPGLPVIVASAYSDYEKQCRAAGCDHFIQKPIDIALLTELLMSYRNFRRSNTSSVYQ